MRPNITDDDIAAVVAVLKTPNLSLGPKIPEFERTLAEYVGVKYAAAVNSGTSALHLSLLAADINKPEYEVITSSFTFIASANVAIHARAKPIFAEIDEESLNITPDTVMEKITDKTKAIIPVDIFGKSVDMKGFREIADDHNLFYLADTCEALGTIQDGKHVGSLADAATFAFYPNKQITTGEGGMVVSDNLQFIEKVNSYRNQGRGNDKSWLLHDKIGYNYRMSDINAALGISQLKRIEQIIAQKKHIVEMYNELFEEYDFIKTPTSPQNERTSWFVYVPIIDFTNTKLTNRDELIDKLRNKNIQAGRYFSPVHLQPIYRELFNYSEGSLPITEKIATQTLALPFYAALTREDILQITNTVINLLI